MLRQVPRTEKGLDAIFADDAKSVALTRDILDDQEKEYDALGNDFLAVHRLRPQQLVRPAPPPGQRGVSPARPGAVEHDRYSKPPKRESVDDRQDRMIQKYSGMKDFTED